MEELKRRRKIELMIIDDLLEIISDKLNSNDFSELRELFELFKNFKISVTEINNQLNKIEFRNQYWEGRPELEKNIK